jgi:hypothetical protein
MRMRIEATALAVILTYAGLSFAENDPPKDDKPAKAPGDKPAKTLEQMSLEELLALAMKYNPDLRVAEAKVREAEEELNQVRLQVSQKLVTLRSKIEAARKTVDEAQARLKRAQELASKNLLSQEELGGAELLVARYRAELAELEGQLPYLVGKPAKEMGKDGANAGDTRAAVDAGLEWLATRQYGARDLHYPVGPEADKLRKALDKVVPLPFDDPNKPAAHLTEIIDNLTARSGVCFLVGSSPKDPPKPLPSTLKEVPLGAALQALEDTLPGLRFTVRDYGILVTYKTDLPPGAVSIHDFWKRDAAKEKGGDKKSDEATINLPPGNVEGRVTTIDEKNDLVAVNVGSDAGLEKGHTLEVFRLEPAIYLATIRIIEVRPKEAVGKIVRKPNEPIKVGDLVSNKIFKK